MRTIVMMIVSMITLYSIMIVYEYIYNLDNIYYYTYTRIMLIMSC